MFGAVARVFVVNVLTKKGVMKVRQLAYSQYHAIELVHTRLREAQPDRQKYTIEKKGLS